MLLFPFPSILNVVTVTLWQWPLEQNKGPPGCRLSAHGVPRPRYRNYQKFGYEKSTHFRIDFKKRGSLNKRLNCEKTKTHCDTSLLSHCRLALSCMHYLLCCIAVSHFVHSFKNIIYRWVWKRRLKDCCVCVMQMKDRNVAPVRRTIKPKTNWTKWFSMIRFSNPDVLFWQPFSSRKSRNITCLTGVCWSVRVCAWRPLYRVFWHTEVWSPVLEYWLK